LNFAGFPTAIEFDGMLLTTTAPAPISALSPIEILPRTIAPVAMRTLLPMMGSPKSFLFPPPFAPTVTP
jgi:hypothetical protein